MDSNPPSRLTRRRALVGSGLLAAAAGAGAGTAEAQAPPPAPANPAEERLHTDWAWLGRYRAENAVDAQRPQAQRRVVFLGDSITQNWRDHRPDFFTANGFLGRGISGQTSPQMLVRFPSDVAALKPEAVHILAGTNDVAQNTGPYDPEATKGWIMAMVELARANGLAVIVGAVPPAGDFPWRPGLGPAVKIQALNAWLRGCAQAQRLVWADYTAVLDNGSGAMRPSLAMDGVHPTAEGYGVMEPVALAAVREALKHKKG